MRVCSLHMFWPKSVKRNRHASIGTTRQQLPMRFSHLDRTGPAPERMDFLVDIRLKHGLNVK